MRNLGYLLVGVMFGLCMTKGEPISWFRIQEMFRFESFPHVWHFMKLRYNQRLVARPSVRRCGGLNPNGDLITHPEKTYHHGIIIGGMFLKRLGQALTGACPGPIYA